MISLSAANFWFNISNITLLVGAFLVAVGTYGVFKTGSIKERYSNERITFNESETAKAKAAASAADENAGVVKKSNLVLQRDLELERAARLKIEGRLAPRHLDDERRKILEAALAPFANQKIEFTVPAGDNEANDYASDFERVFKSAGWDTTGGISQGIFTAPQRGVIPLISEKDKNSPSLAAQRLAATLQSLGLAMQGATDPNLAQGSLRLLVGSKP